MHSYSAVWRRNPPGHTPRKVFSKVWDYAHPSSRPPKADYNSLTRPFPSYRSNSPFFPTKPSVLGEGTLRNPRSSQTQRTEQLDADDKITDTAGNVRVQISVCTGLRKILHLHDSNSSPSVVLPVIVIHHIEVFDQSLILGLYTPQGHCMRRPRFLHVHHKPNTLLGCQCLFDNGIESVQHHVRPDILHPQGITAQLCQEKSCGRVDGVCVIGF